MGCQGSSAVVPHPEELNHDKGEQKEKQQVSCRSIHRISPENILTGRKNFHNRNPTNTLPSLKKTSDLISGKTIKSIELSEKECKENRGKVYTEEMQH